MSSHYVSEKWTKIKFEENISENENYLISNHGRVKSLKVDPIHGMLLKIFSLRGYERLPVTQKNGKKTARYIHKLVAQEFIEKTDPAQQYVIHLDYNKNNNCVTNLKWATKKEKEKHQFNNPMYKGASPKISYSKLSEGKVKLIKRKLANPNRKTRMKMIAKQFGISEMQLYRIKSGENWGYVTPD